MYLWLSIVLQSRINNTPASMGYGTKPHAPTSVTISQCTPTANILQRLAYIQTPTKTCSARCLKTSKLRTANSDLGVQLTIHLLPKSS